MTQETNLLFIYGTLLPQTEHPMSVWLKAHSSEVSNGYMNGHLFLVNDMYPAAVYNAKTQMRVYGLIVKMDDIENMLSVLDRYEGLDNAYTEPNEYYRGIKRVYGSNGKEYMCWIYLYNRDYTNLPLINGGNFLQLWKK